MIWLSPTTCIAAKATTSGVAISVHDEQQWAAFCKAAGHSEWLEDERLCDSFSRHLNVKELDALVTEWTLTLTNMEVMERLQAVGVPAGPSQNNEALINDPQLPVQKPVHRD